MTKIRFEYDDDGSIMFDCDNHAGDHDVCTIISTQCNVLVEACFRADDEPTIYNRGHVRIDLIRPSYPIAEVFRTVEAQMRKVAKMHPEYVMID